MPESLPLPTASDAPRPARDRALLGTLLVACGLFAGTLGTLWLRPTPAPVVVDRDPVTLPVADSGAARVVDASSLNARFRTVSLRARAAVVFVQVEPRVVPSEWLGQLGSAQPERRLDIGSGVIISPEGYIVTNYHVIRRAGDVSVTLPDRRLFDATVLSVDPTSDLAVLKIPAAPDLPILPFGDSDKLQVGDWVLAVGNPYSLASTVTAGIVSALNRQIDRVEDRVQDFIQTDAAINPGNSGGALVNLQGELVGIATSIASESGGFEGYGFAVPSNLALRIASDLIEKGEVERGALGVTLREVTPRLAVRLGLDRTEGVQLVDVPERGAAYQAGVRPGDIVVQIAGVPVNTVAEFKSRIARYRPGERVAVDVLRDGKPRAFAVPLTALQTPASALLQRLPGQDPPMPSDEAPLATADRWGVGLRDLSRAEEESFEADGAYVARIRDGSPASFAGLPQGAVIVSIEGVAITSAEDAQVAFEAVGEGPVLVKIRRRGGPYAYYELLPQ